MERKKLLLIVGLAAIVVLLLCGSAILYGVKRIQGKMEATPAERILITRCDTGPSGLCVISFGTDDLNQMVINLQLPDEEFPEFYARVENRGTSQMFTCNRVEVEPTSAYCIGPRTPLGEAIHLVLFTSDGDQLLAEGNFMVAALILPTFPVGTSVAATEEAAATIEPGGTLTGTQPTDGEFPLTSLPRTPFLPPSGTRFPRPTATPPGGYP